MLTEPLDELAPLAEELAPSTCSALEHGHLCTWYHGALDWLRLLGLVSSPAEDAGFLVPAITGFVRDDGVRRVLISGTADCAMLAQVLNGFSAAGTEPDVTVIDRCATPLRLNEWFAERQGISIRTEETDILAFMPDEPFDLICTHCFLPYFVPDLRPGLMQKWFAMLRPGGKALTVNRIQMTEDHAPTRFTQAQIDSFTERAVDAYDAHPGELGIERDAFRELAHRFAVHFRSVPVRTTGEYRSIFEQSGFRVDAISSMGDFQQDDNWNAGPTEPGPNYMGLIATRP